MVIVIVVARGGGGGRLARVMIVAVMQAVLVMGGRNDGGARGDGCPLAHSYTPERLSLRYISILSRSSQPKPHTAAKNNT